MWTSVDVRRFYNFTFDHCNINICKLFKMKSLVLQVSELNMPKVIYNG